MKPVIKGIILISIKKIKVKTEKQSKEIFSSLNWHLLPVKNIWFANTNYIRTNSSRPFIGKTNEETLEFILTRQRSFLESLFPQVVVKGKLVSENEQKVLVFNFLPGFYTMLIFIILIIMIGVSIWNAIFLYDGSILSKTIVFGIIVIPMFTLMAIYIEFDKTKRKIFELLELRTRKAT